MIDIYAFNGRTKKMQKYGMSADRCTLTKSDSISIVANGFGARCRYLLYCKT